MVLLGAIKDSDYARYNTSCPVYSWVASASCLKSPDGLEYDLKDTSTESVRQFVRRGRKLALFVYPDGMVLDQVVITVGAIAVSSYASYNKLCPVYSWVPGRKAGGQNLKSPLGYEYNSKGTGNREYRCRRNEEKKRQKTVSVEEQEKCHNTVSVHPDGMVLDRVIHHCRSKQDGGKDESESRQLKDTGYVSTNIHPAASSSNQFPMQKASIYQETSATVLLSGNEATNPPHTEHVHDSSIDMCMQHSPLSLEVHAPCTLPDRPAIYPSAISVKEGCNVLLSCKYSDGTYPTGHITWYGPHGIIGQTENDRVYSSTHLLSIDPVMLSDQGYYWCTLETGTQSSVTTLKVTKPPAIQNPIKKQTIYLGETWFISCDIDLGDPVSNVTWYKDNDTVISDARITIMDTRLQIQNIQQSDEGVYMCCAHNTAGSTSLMVAVSCSDGSQLGVPPKFTRNPEDQLGVLPGSPVHFSTEADGINVRYCWKHDGKYMSDDTWRVTGSNTPSLTILLAGPEDEGTYKCVASNEHGEVDSKPAFLELIRVEESDIAQMTVSQTSDPTQFYSFNELVDCSVFEPQYQEDIETGIQTSFRYDIVPTQATDSVGSLGLSNEHSNTHTLSINSNLLTGETDTGEPSELGVNYSKCLAETTDNSEPSELVVTGPMQRMCLLSTNEIDSTPSLACNSQNTVTEELHPLSPISESVRGSWEHSLMVSGSIMRTYLDTSSRQYFQSRGCYQTLEHF